MEATFESLRISFKIFKYLIFTLVCNAKRCTCHFSLCFFAFQCSAKSVAFAIPVLVPFFLLITFSGQTGKSFLSMYYWSLQTTRVSRIRHVSLGTMTNAFLSVLLVVFPDAGRQCLFNISVEFKTQLVTA